ncbi:16S rRNA (guanine(966)-N(2))-methyltransferase RsmD [Croceicoccus sp. F390]|uniref:16S rRNA (Guanine(966)-N(2))-methyltransferase RsmD n=1 Tax=Croceicoccus esteveae TaxID=3075597 RepID=A0ABU2ZF55_9SPHN|nr:16S rRNA (guanine(966)-N(2))-methyltransferase RsmD [Croceicoccus sp. F390]MDT0575230.1 16S rRNA (guanine(966)-N(2))-methyltransferase RsmD [Croceicoccus sp. F390]
MRIIAGKWRGRAIVAPAGPHTRPTADRTRETLFSMLTSRIGSFDGLTVVDLFAGSGALGLEALSRGAAHALFVEQEPAALHALRQNAVSLAAGKTSEIIAGSVMTLGPAKLQPELVFLDPPYGTGAGPVALDRLHRLGWISSGAWIALETGRDEKVSAAAFELDAVRDSGRARLHLMRLKARM